MKHGTEIGWTHGPGYKGETWNPVTGCTEISPGCEHCYAMVLSATRLINVPAYQGVAKKNAAGKPIWTGKLNLLYDRLDQPVHWREPRMIFVNSMSDLFHKDIPFDYILKVFRVMQHCPQHIFQILTKRADVMLKFYKWVEIGENFAVWPLPNVWQLVSVENQKAADERIPYLLQTPAAVKGLSIEPMIGPVDLTSLPANLPTLHGCYGGDYFSALTGKEHDAQRDEYSDEPMYPKIDWAIFGGESNHGAPEKARPMHPKWLRDGVAQCEAAGIPVYFKQWGEWIGISDVDANGIVPMGNTWQQMGIPDPAEHQFDDGTISVCIGKKLTGNLLDGKKYEQYPLYLRDGKA